MFTKKIIIDLCSYIFRKLGEKKQWYLIKYMLKICNNLIHLKQPRDVVIISNWIDFTINLVSIYCLVVAFL